MSNYVHTKLDFTILLGANSMNDDETRRWEKVALLQIILKREKRERVEKR
jgi:hypothetical protein